MAEVDSGSVGRLTDDPNNDGPSCWSRDGQWVYFTSHRTGSVQVWKVAAAGGETRQITRNGGAFALESEDGRFLYYNKEFGYSSIWRVPVDGGEETLILDERIFPRHWALWGTKLVFLLDESANGGASIRSYDLMTGKLEELTSLPRDVPLSLGLSVSADGRWILYSQLDVSGSDLVLVDDFY